MLATELCRIMGECGSDKGHTDINNCWHNYTLLYYKLFNNIRNNNIRIFELGLGTNDISIKSNMGVYGVPGASLYGWSKFFPNAKVFGADIDKNILFENEQIKTYYCDQTNPYEIKSMWDNKDLWEPFDIIVEDGLHEFEANVYFFENSIFKLKKGGYFIIEDIKTCDIPKFNDIISKWKVVYPEYKFNIVELLSNNNKYDNNLVIIQL